MKAIQTVIKSKYRGLNPRYFWKFPKQSATFLADFKRENPKIELLLYNKCLIQKNQNKTATPFHQTTDDYFHFGTYKTTFTFSHCRL